MKKFLLFILLLTFSSTTAFAADTTIEPRASYVFDDVSSYISKSTYGGGCALTDVGSGHVTIYLQKKNSSGTWENVDGQTSKKTFSGTTVCSHSKSKTLSSGTYRCKTYVLAYVNGYTDRRTVYSPTLTVN